VPGHGKRLGEYRPDAFSERSRLGLNVNGFRDDHKLVATHARGGLAISQHGMQPGCKLNE